MFDKVKEKIDPVIESMGLFVDSVYLSKEEGVTNLNICLDSDNIIDIDKITEATKLINPIIDEMNLIEEEYVLDIHSKEKGDSNNE